MINKCPMHFISLVNTYHRKLILFISFSMVNQSLATYNNKSSPLYYGAGGGKSCHLAHCIYISFVCLDCLSVDYTFKQTKIKIFSKQVVAYKDFCFNFKS